VVELVLAHGASTVLYCSRGIDAETATDLDAYRINYPAVNIQHCACDVATSSGRSALVEFVRNHRVTHLDGLVNNVGINIRKDIAEQTEEEFHSIMRTNVDSAYFLCKQLQPLLQRPPNIQNGSDNSSNNSGSAAIVNVSSAAGVRSSGTGIAYAMSKAAINQLTRTLACEWAARGVRVNAVTPWMTVTPLLRAAIRDNPTQLNRVQAWTPLHRLAQPEEIAAPVVFLLLPASSYITGQVLGADGGLTAQGYDGPCVTKDVA
jgi:tropinone reductase I